MKFNYNETMMALSYALDCVEHDLIGVTTNHGKRVATIAIHLGNELGVFEDDYEKQILAACAIMHDCALSEYIQEEFGGSFVEATKEFPDNLGEHCTMGEESMEKMPFDVRKIGLVLYHHETADGKGPFGKRSDEIPAGARLIQIADNVDAEYDLSWIDKEKKDKVVKYIKTNIGILFPKEEANALLQMLEVSDMSYLRNEKIDLHMQEILPGGKIDCTPKELMDFASVFAKIVDYKSHFTKQHSIGIAEKAYEVSLYYGMDEEFATKMYFAGALHDIGKLVVDRDVLEKPDKLNDKEYKHIQTHAYYTYKILSEVPGIEDITRWSAHHHEKLDGTGYPFGLEAKQLGKWERLMACLDIYQALTEERPYKKGMRHERAVEILNDMVNDGMLDREIVKDLDGFYGGKINKV